MGVYDGRHRWTKDRPARGLKDEEKMKMSNQEGASSAPRDTLAQLLSIFSISIKYGQN